MSPLARRFCFSGKSYDAVPMADRSARFSSNGMRARRFTHRNFFLLILSLSRKFSPRYR